LDAYQPGSLFSLIDEQGMPIGEIEQTSRKGLTGYGKLTSGKVPVAGTLLREKLRNLPANTPLKIAVDPKVGPNQAALAKALGEISNVQVVPIGQLSEGGFIVSSLSEQSRQDGKTQGVTLSEPDGSIGLFTSSQGPIAASFGRLDEPAGDVVSRLKPQLKLLLARQFLNLILNAEATQLKVDVSLQSEKGDNLHVLSQAGSRSVGGQAVPKPFKAGDKAAKVDITNREDHPIYLALLSIGDTGAINVLYPANWDSPESASILEKGKSLTTSIDLYGAGFVEVLVITSASQLRDTLQGLQTIARGRGIKGGERIGFDSSGSSRATGEEEDAVVQSTRNLVGDLTRNAGAKASSTTRGLDPKKSGVFSVVVQVAE
jgi:hypothetical protein